MTFKKNEYNGITMIKEDGGIMLIQFNFKNFNSFRDDTTLDLSAAKMTEFSERVVTVGEKYYFDIS